MYLETLKANPGSRDTCTYIPARNYLIFSMAFILM